MRLHLRRGEVDVTGEQVDVTTYMVVTVRGKTEEDPAEWQRFVRVVDDDPSTAKSFRTYNEALLDVIRVVASYAD